MLINHFHISIIVSKRTYKLVQHPSKHPCTLYQFLRYKHAITINHIYIEVLLLTSFKFHSAPTLGYLATYQSGRKTSQPRRWWRFYPVTARTDDFQAFKMPILEHIAVLTFQLINQYSQTAVTFHKRLHNKEQASSNGNQ